MSTDESSEASKDNWKSKKSSKKSTNKKWEKSSEESESSDECSKQKSRKEIPSKNSSGKKSKKGREDEEMSSGESSEVMMSNKSAKKKWEESSDDTEMSVDQSSKNNEQKEKNEKYSEKSKRKESEESSEEDSDEDSDEESGEKIEEFYKVHRVRGVTYDTSDDEYDRKKKKGVVLKDELFTDSKLRLVTEWEDYPEKKDFTNEPVKNLYPCMKGRYEMLKMVRKKYEEVLEKPKRKITKEQEEENAEKWEAFAKQYSKKLRFISDVTDIIPLVGTCTDETEKFVNVRVGSLKESFRRKVVNGRKFERKYPVSWEGSLMFVVIPMKPFAEIYPKCTVYRVWLEKEEKKIKEEVVSEEEEEIFINKGEKVITVK